MLIVPKDKKGKTFMKKIFAIVMTVCLLAGTLCIGAFAAETPSDGIVMRVSGLKRGGDGTLVEIAGYQSFAEGWEAATDFARDVEYMTNGDYDRIVVDLLADWTATDGEFCNSGDGFEYDAIYFHYDTKITLNMNGHTIDRGLESWDYNGEVIWIAENADVIINGGKSGDAIIGPGEDAGDVKMGTITGGFSCNGAGGIHIDDDARVILNNVCVTGNRVEDDKGSAIAMYDGVEFIMNGGCISNNNILRFNDAWQKSEGTVFVDDSTAVFNKVTISQNNSEGTWGLAVCLNGNSDVTLKDCLVEENASERGTFFDSLFFLDDKECVLTLSNTEVRNNGTRYPSNEFEASSLFNVAGTLYINDDCRFEHNETVTIFSIRQSSRVSDSKYCRVYANDSTFVNNRSQMFYWDGSLDGSYELKFTDCTLNKNKGSWNTYTFDTHSAISIIFTDCELGDTSYRDRDKVEIIDTDAVNGAGSIFGAGSLTMIVAVLALVVSVASIGISISMKKSGKPCDKH